MTSLKNCGVLNCHTFTFQKEWTTLSSRRESNLQKSHFWPPALCNLNRKAVKSCGMWCLCLGHVSHECVRETANFHTERRLKTAELLDVLYLVVMVYQNNSIACRCSQSARIRTRWWIIVHESWWDTSSRAVIPSYGARKRRLDFALFWEFYNWPGLRQKRLGNERRWTFSHGIRTACNITSPGWVCCLFRLICDKCSLFQNGIKFGKTR